MPNCGVPPPPGLGTFGLLVSPGSAWLICLKEAIVVAANNANWTAWNAGAAAPKSLDALIIPTAACALSISTFADATALLSPNNWPKAACVWSNKSSLNTFWKSFLASALFL